MSNRYLIVPCEIETGLAVIWDTQEEQVLDVIDAREAARFASDDLWSPAQSQPTPEGREERS